MIAYTLSQLYTNCTIEYLPPYVPSQEEKEDPKKFAKYIQQFGKGISPVVMEPDQVLEAQWAAGNEFRYELN